jgi:hypothetical protein
MAVFRTPPRCHLCGEEYDGIYDDRGPTFVGDTFIQWDIEGHNCRFLKENRKPIEDAIQKIAAESSKFKKMFVGWEIAKRLKNIGFDEPCFAYYWLLKDTFHYTVKYENHNQLVSKVSAPLWHQVIDWFDNKRIFIDIDHEFGEDWEFCIDEGGTGHSGDEESYSSRHVATEQAVLKVISMLEKNGH